MDVTKKKKNSLSKQKTCVCVGENRMLRGVNRQPHMLSVKEINDGQTGVGYYGSAQGNQFPSYPCLNNIPASAPLMGNPGSTSQLYIFLSPFFLKKTKPWGCVFCLKRHFEAPSVLSGSPVEALSSVNRALFNGSLCHWEDFLGRRCP